MVVQFRRASGGPSFRVDVEPIKAASTPRRSFDDLPIGFAREQREASTARDPALEQSLREIARLAERHAKAIGLN